MADAVPKLADILPLRRIESFDGAMRWGKEWESEARHQEARADIYELLYHAYKLQLLVAEREIERLHGGECK